jgi:ssRNA-specific RNase YbeY (16S rRNA maturation enzyme)
VDGALAVKLAIEDFEDLDQSETVELSVMLCNDACIQELNKQWRQKDTSTDVLSFPQDQPPGETPLVSLLPFYNGYCKDFGIPLRRPRCW